MTRWYGLLLLLPGGLLLLSLEWLRRRHAREHAADYVQQIQVLAPTEAEAMKLPPVRDITDTVTRHRKPKAKAATKLRRVG